MLWGSIEKWSKQIRKGFIEQLGLEKWVHKEEWGIPWRSSG